MGFTVFLLSFVYLGLHLNHFGFDASSDAKMLSTGIHALIIALGFVTQAIEGKK